MRRGIKILVKLPRSDFIYESPTFYTRWPTGASHVTTVSRVWVTQVSSQVYIQLQNEEELRAARIDSVLSFVVPLRLTLSHCLQSCRTPEFVQTRWGGNTPSDPHPPPPNPSGLDANAVIICLNKLPIFLASSYGAKFLFVYKSDRIPNYIVTKKRNIGTAFI